MDSSTTAPFWIAQTEEIKFPQLQTQIEVDVAVMGGGIAGMTAAYIIQQSGLSVAVLEKNILARGTTGGTTDKVTAQHGLIYSYLVKHFGKTSAKLYATVYQNALTEMRKLINNERIDCGWQEKDNFVCTTNSKLVTEFKNVAQVAAELGLPASFTTKTELPFNIKGAVMFAGQAQMNAAKYTYGLATTIVNNGGMIFENSQVKHLTRSGNSNFIPTKVLSLLLMWW